MCLLNFELSEVFHNYSVNGRELLNSLAIHQLSTSAVKQSVNKGKSWFWIARQSSITAISAGN